MKIHRSKATISSKLIKNIYLVFRYSLSTGEGLLQKYQKYRSSANIIAIVIHTAELERWLEHQEIIVVKMTSATAQFVIAEYMCP